jgi:hypothetical protein
MLKNVIDKEQVFEKKLIEIILLVGKMKLILRK